MASSVKDFEDWITAYSAALEARAVGILAGKYGPWLVESFKTYDDFIKDLDGDAHAKEYVKSRSDVSVVNNIFLGPMHKVRADQLMGLERDLRMYRQNRLSFYRAHAVRLKFTKIRLDLVQKGLSKNDKLGTITAEN